MNDKKALLRAAAAGIMGVAVVAVPAKAASKKTKGQTAEVVKCYGVNKCKGHGKCSGPGNSSCAGQNSCKGQGWLLMPKESCQEIEGGSLTPKEAPAQEKK